MSDAEVNSVLVVGEEHHVANACAYIVKLVTAAKLKDESYRTPSSFAAAGVVDSLVDADVAGPEEDMEPWMAQYRKKSRGDSVPDSGIGPVASDLSHWMKKTSQKKK